MVLARASSIISVGIVGDAKKLVAAVKDADKATGGLLKAAGGAFLATAGVATAFDIAGSSLEKADAMADAFDRLDSLITPEFSKSVEDVAFNMSNLGLSADEVGTLATNFAALATAAGVSKDDIAKIVPDLLDVATAISAKTGKTVDEVVTDLGKAAAGNQKAVSDYGIVVDKALNPDDRVLDILKQAEALFGSGADAMNDYAGKQEQINAKFDNMMVKLGEALEGPMAAFSDVILEILDELADWPGAIQDIGKAIEDMVRTVAAPLGNLNDLLGGIGDFFGMNHKTTLSVNMAADDRAMLEAVQRESRRNEGPSKQGRDLGG